MECLQFCNIAAVLSVGVPGLYRGGKSSTILAIRYRKTCGQMKEQNEYDTIVTPDTLKAYFTDRDDGPPWVVVDCRFNLMQPQQGREEYHAGHIPGAFYAHLDADLSSPVSPDSGRHPLPDRDAFARLAGSWGVGPDTQVVVYDQGSGAIAARLWWLLRWIGHGRTALLEGGYTAWLAAGGALDAGVPERIEDASPAGVRGEHASWTGTEELAVALGRVRLIDARDTARFRGEQEPIDTVAGHIPGAINRPFSDNLDKDGRFHDADTLRRQFLSLPGMTDITEGTAWVVNMCGSGVTACHNILAMEIAGLGGSTLYAGSWSEWIRDPSRAVVTGE